MVIFLKLTGGNTRKVAHNNKQRANHRGPMEDEGTSPLRSSRIGRAQRVKARRKNCTPVSFPTNPWKLNLEAESTRWPFVETHRSYRWACPKRRGMRKRTLHRHRRSRRRTRRSSVQQFAQPNCKFRPVRYVTYGSASVNHTLGKQRRRNPGELVSCDEEKIFSR